MPMYHTVLCANGLYLCRSQECITLDNICDGYVHCSDATDERYCRITQYRQYLQRRRGLFCDPLCRVYHLCVITRIIFSY